MWIFDWDHGGFRNREEGRFVRVRDLVEAANAGRWEPPQGEWDPVSRDYVPWDKIEGEEEE